MPANGSFSDASPKTFSFAYYLNCSTSYGLYDFIGIDLTDTDTGEQSRVPFGSPNICGQTSITSQVILSLNDNYLWRPVMYSSHGSSTPIYGNYYSFLASSSPNYTPVPQNVGSATSTLPNTYNLLSFLNVPTLLKTKIPFAYFFQIAEGIQAGVNSSSSTAIPSGAFVWTGIGGATTTFDMFSTSTISYYLSPTLIGLWRNLLLVVLYIEFGYALYQRAKSQHLI